MTGGAGTDTLTVNIPENGAYLINQLHFDNVTTIERLVIHRDAGFELPSQGEGEFTLSGTSFNTLVMDAPFDLEGTFRITGGSNLKTIIVEKPIGPNVAVGETPGPVGGGTVGRLIFDQFTSDSISIDANAEIETNLSVVNSDNIPTVTISGAANVNLGQLSGADDINAQALTGDLVLMTVFGVDSTILGGAGDDYLTSAANGGNDTFDGGAGDDIIDLTADNSGRDTVAYHIGQDGNDTILGFRAVKSDDVESDIMRFDGVVDANELAEEIANITFVENGGYEENAIDGNTVDLTINFQNGGSITFADFMAIDTDVEILFGNAVFTDGQGQDASDKVISEGETVIVTGVTDTDMTSALDVVFV